MKFADPPASFTKGLTPPMRPVSLAALPVYNEAAHVDEVLDNVLQHLSLIHI